MKPQCAHSESQEPIGIVIATGIRGDVRPRFSAFVWGPVPETEAVPLAPEAKAA
jgi:hypothetical protein